MKRKIAFFIIVACALMVASNAIYTGVRVTLYGMDVQIPTTAAGFVAGTISLLFVFAGHIISLRRKEMFESNIIVFNDKGGKFLLTVLLLLIFLIIPGYFVIINNVKFLVYIIEKENLNIVDAIFIPLMTIYAILIAKVMLIKVDLKNNNQNADARMT